MLGVALFGCGETGPPARSPDLPAPSVSAARTPEPVSLEMLLDNLRVTDVDFLRSEFYTWTTPKQVEALRATGRLLVTNAASGGHSSPYNRLLAELAPEHPIAKRLLEDPRLNHQRYAWPHPFATVMGRGPRRYGDALIRIELTQGALIGRLDPKSDPVFAFYQLSGARVPLSEVLEHPDRIGAIFHVRTQENMPLPFREYVVCSEALVARWSVGTAEIAEHLDREIELLEVLAAGPFATLAPAQVKWRATQQWHRATSRPSLVTRWHAALAFDNLRYRPSPSNLAAIVATLRGYDPVGVALVGPL